MAIKTAGKTFCDLKTESAETQTSTKTSASPSEENNNASKTTSRNTRP
jgi:hypothetical protein